MIRFFNNYYCIKFIKILGYLNKLFNELINEYSLLTGGSLMVKYVHIKILKYLICVKVLFLC